MIINLPFPPTTNTLFPTGKHGKRFKSKKYVEWLVASTYSFKGQHILRMAWPNYEWMGESHTFTGPVEVSIRFGWPKRQDGKPSERKRDLDNLAKAPLDFLTQRGVWTDDSLIQKLTLEWAPIEGCEITIEGVDDASH